jgi:hypothetical protein
LGKGAESLVNVPKALKVRASEIKERELQLQEYRSLLESRRQREEDEAWEVVEILEESEDIDSYNKQNFKSILTFLGRLPIDDIKDAAEMAVDRGFTGERRFKYFCGICWNMIREGRE